MDKAFKNMQKYQALIKKKDRKKTSRQRDNIYGNIGANRANFTRLFED